MSGFDFIHFTILTITDAVVKTQNQFHHNMLKNYITIKYMYIFND